MHAQQSLVAFRVISVGLGSNVESLNKKRSGLLPIGLCICLGVSNLLDSLLGVSLVYKKLNKSFFGFFFFFFFEFFLYLMNKISLRKAAAAVL